jgi:hypothetical protein
MDRSVRGVQRRARYSDVFAGIRPNMMVVLAAIPTLIFAAACSSEGRTQPNGSDTTSRMTGSPPSGERCPGPEPMSRRS